MYRSFSFIICFGSLLLFGFGAAQKAEHVVRTLKEVSVKHQVRELERRTDDTWLM